MGTLTYDEYQRQVMINALVANGQPVEVVESLLHKFDFGGSIVEPPIELPTFVSFINPNSITSTLGLPDYFGTSVAIRGAKVVVGAPYEDSESAPPLPPNLTSKDVGKAYVYDLVGNQLEHTLDNPSQLSFPLTPPVVIPADDYFGLYVAISDSYVIVGVDQAAALLGSPPAPETNAGTTYIFDVNTGAMLHKITPPDGDGGMFGSGVTISSTETRILIGAPGVDAFSGPGEGIGVVYQYDPATGQQDGVIHNPDRNTYTSFGQRTAISSDYIASTSGTIGSGDKAVHIFSAGSSNFLHTILNPTPGAPDGDGFASVIDMCDDYIIVGARQAEDPGEDDSGKAYIFDPSTGGLLHTLNNPSVAPAPNENFGGSVAINQSYAIVGTPGTSDGGQVHIYDPVTGNLLHTLTNPNMFGAPSGDNFGISVALDGRFVIIGASHEQIGGGDPHDTGVVYGYDIEVLLNP